MENIVSLAKERAELFNAKNVVVATNSGATANLVLEVFGSNYNIYAVGNPSSAHERGLVHHTGVSEETRRRLEDRGIKVVLQDQSLFQTLGHDGTFHGSPLDEVIENAAPGGIYNTVAIIFNTLQLFGDAPRVYIEVTLMAADSGLLPLDADCISIARPSMWSKHHPDAAMILRPAKTQDIFKRELRVKDLVLVPSKEDRWFSNGPMYW